MKEDAIKNIMADFFHNRKPVNIINAIKKSDNIPNGPPATNEKKENKSHEKKMKSMLASSIRPEFLNQPTINRYIEVTT